MKQIMCTEARFNELRKIEIEKLKIQYYRKPESYKKLNSISEFIEQNLSPQFSIANNKNIKKTRFIGKNFKK